MVITRGIFKRHSTMGREHALGSVVLRRLADAFLLTLLMAVVFLSLPDSHGHASGPQDGLLYRDDLDDHKGEVWDPLIFAIVAIIIFGGIIFRIRRTMKMWYRRGWQQNAKDEEPPETCQLCTRHCRKIELEPVQRKITHLTLGAGATVSSKQGGERQVKGEIVEELNRAVSASRLGEKQERIQEVVAPLARELLQRIEEWLGGEPAPNDVPIFGHLQGGRVTCQFILYHCRRKGIVDVWEEEDKWQATINDERDEHVGSLRGRDLAGPGVTERMAPEMTKLIMQFIERV